MMMSPLDTICMECQNQSSEKNEKKNVINLSSAENLTHSAKR